MALPGLPRSGSAVRSLLAYSACTALVLIVGLAGMSARPLPIAQAPIAFGFSVFVLLLFLAVAAVMTRSKTGPEPAAALAGAVAVVHALMAYHAPQNWTIYAMPAAVVWMPVAGWLTLVSLLAGRRQEKGSPYLAAIAVAAQVLPVFALPAFGAGDAFSRHAWNRAGGALLGGEFLLLSVTWLALRVRLRQAPFRADLLGVFGNAALFYALLWTTAGDATAGGIVVVAAYAVGMAVYHALVGGLVLRSDEPLHRYAFLGLAATFFTIAIPLQFHERTITTLAWAVEALALLGTGLKFRDVRTRWYGMAVLALAAGKALLLDLPRNVEPFRFLLNGRMLAGVAVIVAAYIAAEWLWKRKSRLTADEQSLIPALLTVANFYTLLFVSVDLWQFADRAWPADRHGAPQLALSLFWTVYALGAICIGMWKRSRPVRLFAMALLYLSISKVFLYDLSGLEQPYRIISFFTLGVILLYTRFEEWMRETEHSGTAAAA
jgi:hypothetical protein